MADALPVLDLGSAAYWWSSAKRISALPGMTGEQVLAAMMAIIAHADCEIAAAHRATQTADTQG